MTLTSPDFEEFERIVQDTLGLILQRLGLEGPEIELTPPEMAMKYRRSDSRVTVLYEYGDAPWIKVETLSPAGKWKARSLDTIAKSRNPGAGIKRPSFGQVTTDSVRALFVAYSDALEAAFRP